MARIAGVDLPRDKRIEYALPYIYGIGLTLSREILSKTGTAEEKVEELLEMALSRGGRDNVTMILAQINGYEEKNPLKRWAERHSTGR